MAGSSRLTRGVATAIAGVIAALVLMTAAPAFGATSVITQADCNSGNITRNGRVLTRTECEALIGQRVNLAGTGFDAWIVGLGGVVLLAGTAVVWARRRRTGAQPA